MSQSIGLRGAPVVSWPGFAGPGPSWCQESSRTGWTYYGLPNGPSTATTDYRVGSWNWGWNGYPSKHTTLWEKYLTVYGPPSPSYIPTPGSIGGSDSHHVYMNPPRVGYGLNSFAYRSASPRLSTPSVSVFPSTAQASPGCCRVDVRLPCPDATLWINQSKTSSTGLERTFESSRLTEGKEFRYELRASWNQDGKEVTDSRTIVVARGNSWVVDFTRQK